VAVDMLTTAVEGPTTLAGAEREREITWWWAFGCCLALTVAMGALTILTAPRPFSLAFVAAIVAATVILTRPVTGLYLMVFLAVIGDTLASPWYPFTKNLSSLESVLYVSDQAIFSPFEICLVALVLAWFLQMMKTRQWVFHHGRLLRPILVFAAFVAFGLVFGLARGGNSNVALWQARPLLYVPVVYILLTNLLRRRGQYVRLYWLIMIAISINGIFALLYYRGLSAAARDAAESFVQHGAAVGMNTMFILIGALWMYPKTSRWARLLLPVAAIPVVAAYLFSQRRAGFIALLLGAVVLAAMLYTTNRRAFWRIVPAATLVLTAFIGVFWNNQGSLGFPSQAVKSVIAPGQLEAKDQSSDLYRKIENYDLVYTIRSNPLTGTGFGQPFQRPLPLPDISFYVFYEFVPHNSVLFLWVNLGIGGLMAGVYLIGRTLSTGAFAALHARPGNEAAITVAAVAFVMMFAMFAYVDIAWDAQNMVLLAVAMAQISVAAAPPPAGREAQSVEPVVARA
jgi:hypothetical protein